MIDSQLLWNPFFLSLPALGAALCLPMIKSIEWVRRTTIAATVMVFLLTTAAVVLAGSGSGLIGLFGLLTATVTLAITVSAPRTALSTRLAFVLLLSEFAALSALGAPGPLSLLFFWILALLPGLLIVTTPKLAASEGRLSMTYGLFLIGSVVPLAVVLLVLATMGMDAVTPTAVIETTSHLSPVVRTLLFLLVAVSALMRMAAAPLHGWLPVLLEQAPIGFGALISSTPLGLFVLVQIGLPLLGEAGGTCLAGLGVLGLAGGVYGAVLALPQTDLRRLIAALRVSQAGFLLAGVAAGNSEGLHGALTYGVALGMTVTGMLLIVWAMQARTGTTSLSAFGGLAAQAPSMAASFLVLGFASIGFPGTLSFIAEDLLLHGILGWVPLGSVVFVIATATNAVTIMRVFQRTFLGPRRGVSATAQTRVLEDLRPRERGVAFALALSAVVAGVVPGPILAFFGSVAQTLTTH